MRRNWFLCLLVWVTVVLSLGDALEQVRGQAKPREVSIIVQPGKASTLGLINQAEAAQQSYGKIAVSTIGVSVLPDNKN